APWLANGLDVLGLSPWPGLDLTPFAFTFTIAMVTLLVLRMRFLDMVPIAYERVVASMTDGVLVLDHQDRVLDMNAAGLASIGRHLRDVIGKPVEQVLVEVPGLLEQYRHVDYLDDEIEIPDGPHGLQVFGVRVSRIMSHDGRPRGRLVVWRDVTERRRAADLLRTQNEELVRLQAFLERAIDEARTANRAKSTFLANISHELRTPLNAILGYSELMQLDLKRERSERFQVELDAVQTAGKQLLDLINSLLDLSKIEAERIELSVDSFLVSDLLAEIKQTMFPLIVQAGNTLTIDCAEDAGQIHTDRTKLRQILLNLLGNATKFTHRGRIDVRVGRLQRDTGPDMLSIAVQDTGIGIADNDLPLLFQDFVQVDSSSTRRYGGTGLGLAISRRFCHMLGGEISVASSVGVGTTFTVLVPADLEQSLNTEHNDGPPAPTPIIKRAS
ncbi:MAG TPA: ATP-binding protein, partial [Roseiflexaceae bacterium]|nr:ATP-binding protein [Roseiflexaceae bacterium]